MLEDQNEPTISSGEIQIPGAFDEAEAASEATSTAVAEPQPTRAPATPDAGGFIWGTGRRKAAIARVRVKPGDGKFIVNNREIDEFFTELQHREACLKPLKTTEIRGKVDVFANVSGGGITGQAEAVLLGVARALKDYDPSLEQALRDEGYLSRDPRKVERKKYGQRGARRRFQFSKR